MSLREVIASQSYAGGDTSMDTKNGWLRSLLLPQSASIVTLILVIFILMRSCSGSTQTAPPGPLPSGHEQILDDVKLPDGVLACDPLGGVSTGYSFTCSNGLVAGEIRLSNVPDGVTPYLLPASPSDLEEWGAIPMDGFNCPINYAGNLMFGSDGSLVTKFKAPITLQFDTSSPDVANFANCQSDAQSDAINIPVFLYSYNNDGVEFQVWKPFQNYTLDANGMFTVEFKVWGDTPIGKSVLQAPKIWGPP